MTALVHIAPCDLSVVIPGDPVPHGRPRITTAPRWGSRDHRPRAITPLRTRAWIASAQAHYLRAMAQARAPRPAFTPDVPLEVIVVAVFALPKADQRKRKQVPSRPRTAEQSDDADNLAKSVLDAGNGVLWRDDGQVSRLVVERWTGAQGEEPHVLVVVREWRNLIGLGRAV